MVCFPEPRMPPMTQRRIPAGSVKPVLVRKRFDGCSAAESIPTCVGDDSGGDAEGDRGGASGGSTSMATCVADGDVGGAGRSSVTSIATCVANGVVIVTAAPTCVGGGLFAAAVEEAAEPR